MEKRQTNGAGLGSPSNGGRSTEAQSASDKQRRTAAACDECRSRKVKCDGQKPACSQCVRRNPSAESCTWSVRRRRGAGVSQTEFRNLERRLHELENVRKPQSVQHSQTMTPTHDPATVATATSTVHGVQEPEESMTMMGLLEDEDQTRLPVPDDPSANAFVNRIKGFIGQNTRLEHQKGNEEFPRVRPRRQTRLSLRALEYVIPSRQRADYLLSCYWRRAVYPCIDADEVQAFYRQLWIGEDLGEAGPAFLCLLNMLFSIACLSDPNIPPSERVDNADVYYHRARQQVDIDFLNIHSLLSVRCFLLMGEFLQSKNDPKGCWTFIGLAIRLAQGLRLDAPTTSENVSSTHERQKMRRVWHMCVLMDRSLAMAFGRPAMITPRVEGSIPYPSAHKHPASCKCFDGHPILDPTDPPEHFFIEALKLYEVMHEIWLALYNPISNEDGIVDTFSAYFGKDGANAAGTVLRVHAKLTTLADNLPLYLRRSSSSYKSTLHQRQTNILWLRHRHISLLLFRPVLARFCNPNTSTPSGTKESFPWKIALHYSIFCTETAFEIVNFLDEITSDGELREFDDLLPGWWYSILFVYTAAGVLLAAHLHPAIVSEVSEQAITHGWQRAMEILGRFASFSRYAATCATSLNRLFKQVRQQESDVRRGTSPQQESDKPLSRPAGEQVTSEQQQYDFREAPSAGLAHNSLQLCPDPAAWSNPFYGMPEASLSMEYTSGDDAYDGAAPLPLDLDDMSWLTALPFQLFEPTSTFVPQIER